jgi:hypothetical protein
VPIAARPFHFEHPVSSEKPVFVVQPQVAQKAGRNALFLVCLACIGGDEVRMAPWGALLRVNGTGVLNNVTLRPYRDGPRQLNLYPLAAGQFRER